MLWLKADLMGTGMKHKVGCGILIFYKAESTEEGTFFREQIFVNKKVVNRRTKTTFIISVLKVLY